MTKGKRKSNCSVTRRIHIKNQHLNILLEKLKEKDESKQVHIDHTINKKKENKS